jgi:putative transposase
VSYQGWKHYAFIEAFNSRFRTECLNTHWFLGLADAKEKMGK